MKNWNEIKVNPMKMPGYALLLMVLIIQPLLLEMITQRPHTGEFAGNER